MAIVKTTMSLIQPLLQDVFRAGLVPNILSSPGLGKSALAKQLAKKFNLKLIDIRLSYFDPADLNGFPFILNKDAVAEKIRAGFVPLEIFPIKGDPLPIDENGKQMAGWAIIMDEFNSAQRPVQAASYKVVLDKQVGMHDLHKNVVMMCAGNLSTDKAIVNDLGTAMQSRLINFVLKVCEPSFQKWANGDGDIDYRVKSFISFKSDMLHMFDPNHDDLTFPCPRTWEFMSKIIKPMGVIGMEKLPLLSGTVGYKAGQEFFSYCQLFQDIPTIADIENDPMGCRLGTEKSVHYAMSGMVGGKMTPANATPLVQFLSRLDIDFQVVTLRAAIARDRDIRKNPEIAKWISHNASELL
jgi:hypothetical protein